MSEPAPASAEPYTPEKIEPGFSRKTEKYLLKVRKRKVFFKRKHLIARAFEDAKDFKMASRLRGCGEKEIAICCEACCDHFWTIEHCRNRVCPICSWRVQQERKAFVEEKLKDCKYPKLLTLTMARWTGDPREGISFLRKKFNTLRKRQLFSFCTGGAYTIELKRKPDGWHIHVHLLLDAPYIPRQKIFSAWKQILGVEFASVDIRAAKSATQRAYVCKYACKGVVNDGDLDDVIDWYYACKGLRLWGTFGTWYRKKEAEEFQDDPAISAPKKCPLCGEEATLFPFLAGAYIYKNDWDFFEQYHFKAKPGWRNIEEVANILAE